MMLTLLRQMNLSVVLTRQRCTIAVIVLLLTAAFGQQVCQAEPAQAQSTAIDYSRLNDPKTAAALELSAEQQAAITKIITERDAVLEGADEPTRAQAIAEATTNLAAVLTQQQKTAFEQGKTLEPRLKFNFRIQKWAEVLDWMADEAGLSLVMDEAPPGTFNYSDSKEYTPTEAIDLLNGWLMTKGYTLVRRERLLMCLNLKGGLPDNAIPRVSVDDLADRGRFEFVSVLIPLQGRLADTVLAEIKPLLGTYGQADVLTATQQLLVVDSTANIRTIQGVVQQVPLPAKPKAPAPKVPAPKPELVVYPIQHANPEQAGEVLKTIISGTLVVDTAAGQISVNAIPGEQAKAKIIIEQLESNQGSDKQPVLKMFPIRTSDPLELLATLQLVAPDAQFRYDEASRKLVAWGNPLDQSRIAKSLEEMNGQQPNGGRTQLEVYPLKDIAPTTAESLITTLLPDARVTLDARTSSLVAIGTLTEHQAIRELLLQLEQQTASVQPGELKSYPVDSAIIATAPAVIASVVPEATVTPDAVNERLLVVASPEKHEQVSGALKQLTEDLAKPDQQLKIYSAADVDVPSVTALLATLAPTAQITSDIANERLLVIANGKDHAAVDNVLAQVADADPRQKPMLKSYPLAPKVSADTTIALLASLTPSATVTSDAASRRLLITATPQDHEVIAATIAQVSQDAGGEIPELQFYPLQKASGINATAVLKAMLPATTVTFDAEAERISVVGTKADHAVVVSTLAKLEATTPPDEKRSLKIYDVTARQRTRFTAVLASLTTELPGLQVLTDAQPGEMTVWAKPSQHEIVAEVLTQLQREVPLEEQPRLIVYPITKVDVVSVSTVLVELFPDVKITADTVSSRLLIHAKPAVHETIRAAIEQLDSDIQGETEIKLMVYPINGVDSTVALQLLNTEVPRVTVIHDTSAQTFIVRAGMEQQQQVAALLDSLTSASTQLQKRTAVVYRMVQSTGVTAKIFFEKAFPDASFMLDPIAQTMTALASEQDQNAIRQTVEAMSNDDATKAKLKEYPVLPADITGVSRMLKVATPKAQVVFADSKLLAWGMPQEHEIIQGIVDGLQTSSGDRRIEGFDVTKVELANALAVLGQQVPDVSFITAQDGKSVVALVDGETKQKIQTTLTQLAESPAAAAKRTLKFYDIETAGGLQAQTVLATAVPTVAFTLTQDAKRLLGLVTDDEHQKIEATLQQLTSEKPFAPDTTLKLYSVKDAGPSATTVLMQSVPTAAISSGAHPDQIAVVATATDHEKVKEVLLQLQTASKANPQKTLVVYDIRGTDPAAVQAVLQPLIDADVNVTADSTGRRLYVRAFPEQQQKVKSTIEQITSSLNPDDQLKTKTYLVGAPNADEAQEVLLALYPDATIVTDSDRKLIVATATSEQHIMIEQIAQQMAEGGTLENAPYAVVYSVENVSAVQAQSILTSLFTRIDAVRISVNERTGRLVAVARKDQHSLIADIMNKFDGDPAAEIQRDLAVYRVQPLDGLTVKTALEPLVSEDVLISADRRGSEILVSAPPEEQKKIAKLIQEMTASRANAGMETRTYRTKKGDADTAQTALATLFPDATLVTDRLDQVLVATATPEQHKTIETVVEQMSTARIGGAEMQTKTYSMNIGDALVAQTALQSLFPDATLVTDRRYKLLVATATPEQHQTIDTVVQQMMKPQIGGADLETKTYRMNVGDADAAQTALLSLFPQATLVTDRRDKVLVATATPEQHRTIETVVNQMNGADLSTDRPVPKTYRLIQADGKTVINVLEDLFETVDEVRLSLDVVNQAVVAIARPDQHQLIEQALADLDPKEGAAAYTLQVYPVEDLDEEQVRQVVDDLLVDRFPGSKVHHEAATGNLLVTTNQAGHTLVEGAMARFGRPEPREADVFQLTYLEPFTAQTAIENLVSSRYPNEINQPIVYADEDTQQLWVQASKTQLAEMRTLLMKMGERGLETSDRRAANPNLRIIPVGDNVEETIKRIQDLWPKIRRNPIRIMRPEGTSMLPNLPSSEFRNASLGRPNHVLTALREDGASQNKTTQDQPETEKPAASSPAQKALPKTAVTQSSSDVPAVVIVPGDGQLTIASDDAEALDQLESLLRAMHSRPGGGGRNQDFGVYQLTNAGAVDVSTTLQQIFDDSKGLISFGGVVMVPDERLNALIVYASRADRGRIEQLLEILDSENYEDTRRSFRTEVVPLQYASADRVEDVIQGVYAAERTSGGARGNIAIPKGVPSNVASVLRQINAAASSPLLTVEVQTDTNSLVIKAPQELLDEVKDLIERLDNASRTTRAKGITLLPLKKANSSRVMRILNDVLK